MTDRVTESIYRRERIERLLQELRYEIERGMMEREIDESLGFQFIVPRSTTFPDGIVHCEFRTRPMPFYAAPFLDGGPRLRLVRADGSYE
jgi:hypothetical protein